MKKISLSLKVSFSFIMVSIATLAFLYTVFFHLFEQYILKVEEEKAMLIAQTIEPLIAMSHYLNLDDETQQLARKLSEHKQVVGLTVVLGNKIILEKEDPDIKDNINITYPITNPLGSEKMGSINISYTKDNFNNVLINIHNEILYYLSALSLIFIVYIVIIRYLFSPFAQIATKVKDYIPGSKINFSSIRAEPEIDAISEAFESMVSNIEEYTVLLERYKHSVDESSIVVKMDIFGNITYVNNEFCRLSGYTQEEALGKSIFTICHVKVDEENCEDMLNQARDKKIWKGNLQNKRKNGTDFYVRVTVVPIIDAQENIIELISIQQDITQAIEQQEIISKQATDISTGLYNRVKLEEDISKIDEPKFAIISLENYSVINHYYGLSSGNKILKEVSEIFLSITAIKEITVYKLAGSEFAILGTKTFSMDLFHEICRTVLNKINKYTIELDNGTININASAGLTSDKAHYLIYAGLALQHALDTRHLTIIYEETENLVKNFEYNLIWTKKLNLALNENRIALYIQPILNTETLKIEKYECLVRMIDEDGKNVISPLLFLDVAKKSKLYHQITEQVIKIAFDIFSKVPDIDFSINITIDDILHAPTVQLLKNRLHETGLASRFVLEIVESEGIEDITDILDFVTSMKGAGCKIAIDDFGSGYSNFAYLLQLDVDYIKIDGSLIKTIDHDVNSQIITSTILDFSRQLKIKTVAEFVHNQEVLDYAKKIGVDYVQGFHLGEPIPIETLLP